MIALVDFVTWRSRGGGCLVTLATLAGTQLGPREPIKSIQAFWPLSTFQRVDLEVFSPLGSINLGDLLLLFLCNLKTEG